MMFPDAWRCAVVWNAHTRCPKRTTPIPPAESNLSAWQEDYLDRIYEQGGPKPEALNAPRRPPRPSGPTMSECDLCGRPAPVAYTDALGLDWCAVCFRGGW